MSEKNKLKRLRPYLGMPDFDLMYKHVPYPILINKVPYVTVEDRKAFNSIIMTKYENDVLSNIPTCACGLLSLGSKLGDRCDVCETKVEFPSEGDIDYRTWMGVPNGIRGFIIPVVWVQLTKLLNATGYNLLTYMLTSKGNPPDNINKITVKRIKYLTDINFPRGWNNFIDNFDWFIEILPALGKISSTNNMRALAKYAEYLKSVRTRVFPKFMPLPVQVMLVLDQMNYGGGFADKKTIAGAIVAARTIADIERAHVRPLSMTQVEQKMLSVINNMVSYYVATIKTTFCSKKGWIRGCIWRSKFPWAGRAVIKSLTGPHDDREIHIPWTVGVEMFKYHIFNKLSVNGHGYLESVLIVNRAVNVYNPYVSDIIKQIIAEAPFIGFPCSFQRNPSLDRLSAQLFYITIVKEDLRDNTISMSALKVIGPHADFDGDEMNLSLFLDVVMYNQGKYLDSYYGIHDITNLGQLSKASSLPDVNLSVIGNWVNEEVEEW